MKIGFTGLLTVLFVGLKLAGIITWSWLWVLSPLWIGLLVGLGFISIVFVMSADPAPRSHGSYFPWR